MTETAKSVLVTGGAGFIGSNFVHYLLAARPDVRVFVLDKLTYAGNEENLALVRGHPNLTFVCGDVCDEPLVRELMQGCQWVVNFAAETHVDRSIENPRVFIHTDVEGAYTLLEAAREAHLERFLQISTDEVYGNAEAPDGTSRPSLETDALKPLSPYAASKAAADRLAFAYWATYGVPVVITRCSNNYGPYQYPEKQLPLFITNALANRALPVYGDGQNTRDWIYVLDHCRALLQILEAPAERVEGEVFNVGSGEERSILQNAEVILDQLGKSRDLIKFVPDRLGHVRRHAVNSSKLVNSLGWQIEVPYQEGIAATIAWYSSHSDWTAQILSRQDTFLQKALTLAEMTARR